ncbi:MAG: GGDEF domain-containing protein [Chlorobiales bacterium]|nr:GGDEF domain-containing protein [Chlorobiales bacterium]
MSQSIRNTTIKELKDKLSSATDENERVDILNTLVEEIYYTNTAYALELSRKAHQISKTYSYLRGIAASLYHKGLCQWRLSNNDEALPHLLEALWHFEELSDKRGEAKTLACIGNVFRSLSDFEQAVSYLLQSLKIYQETNDKRGQAEILSSIGVIFMSLSNYREALPYYQRSLALHEEFNDKQGIAHAFNNIGSVSFALGKYEEALPYYEQCIKLSKSLGDALSVAEALNNMGRIYEQLVDNNSAMSLYSNSLSICQQIGHRSGEAKVLLSIGKLYLKQDDINNALQYLQDALTISEAVKARELTSNVCLALSGVYEQKGDYEKALAFHKTFYSHQEALISKDITSKIYALKQSFETQSSQKEVDYFRQKHEKLLKSFRELQTINISLQAENEAKSRLVEDLIQKQLNLTAEFGTKDALTEIYQLSSLSSKFKKEFDNTKTNRKPLTIGVCEIDYFESISKRHESETANDVLLTVSQLIKEQLRETDMIARHQGAKFVILFPDQSILRTFIACERMRRAVDEYRWGQLQAGLKVTICFGLTDDISVSQYEHMLSLAETKLDAARQAGGNQVRS